MIDERDIERAAARLGGRTGAQVDADRIAEAVVARLRTARVTAWWRSPALLQAAAVVIIALGVSVLLRSPTEPVATQVATAGPVQLDALSATELEEVLDSLVIEAPAHQNVTGGFDDLDESQLRELLRRMEG